MKKIWLLAILMLVGISLTSCGSKPGVKSEVEILEDLETCHFVSQYIDQTYSLDADLTNTLGDDFYTITGISILARETVEKESDTVTIMVEAKSDIASYKGNYELSYRYQKKEGFVLDKIKNISESNLYYDLTPPNESLVLDFYNEQYGEPTLVDVAVIKEDGPSTIKGVDAVYHAEISYSYRDEEAHCTVYETALYFINFMKTHWEIGEFIYTDYTKQKCEYDIIQGIYLSVNLSDITIINAYELDGAQYYDRYPYMTDIQYGGPFIITYGFSDIEQGVKVIDHYLDMEAISARKISDSNGQISKEDAFSLLLNLYELNQLDSNIFDVSFVYDGDIDEYIERLGVLVSKEKAEDGTTVVTIRIKTALDD